MWIRVGRKDTRTATAVWVLLFCSLISLESAAQEREGARGIDCRSRESGETCVDMGVSVGYSPTRSGYLMTGLVPLKLELGASAYFPQYDIRQLEFRTDVDGASTHVGATLTGAPFVRERAGLALGYRSSDQSNVSWKGAGAGLAAVELSEQGRVLRSGFLLHTMKGVVAHELPQELRPEEASDDRRFGMAREASGIAASVEIARAILGGRIEFHGSGTYGNVGIEGRGPVVRQTETGEMETVYKGDSSVGRGHVLSGEVRGTAHLPFTVLGKSPAIYLGVRHDAVRFRIERADGAPAPRAPASGAPRLMFGVMAR